MKPTAYPTNLAHLRIKANPACGVNEAYLELEDRQIELTPLKQVDKLLETVRDVLDETMETVSDDEDPDVDQVGEA